MIDVACVGILVADIIANPIDAMPEKGKLSLISSTSLHSGGNAMTAAVNLRKMGLRSSVVGKVGADAFGSFLEEILKKEGVDTRSLAKDQNTQTSTSVVLSYGDGERSFLHCMGANGTFSISDVDWQVIEEAEIVFVTGTFIMDTFDGQQTAEFLKQCKKMGKITALDVCWDSRGRWGDVLWPAMLYIDLFMPSIDEAREIAQAADCSAMADAFFRQGVKKVVIKCGSDGCFLKEGPQMQEYYLPVCPGVKAVDTTGAGDSFCSGFLAAYRKGKSFLDCGRFANAAGAHCVMKKGATTGMVSFEELEHYLEGLEWTK